VFWDRIGSISQSSFVLQVVSVSPELQATGEVTKITAYTSDLIELVSGVCPVSCSQALLRCNMLRELNFCRESPLLIASKQSPVLVESFCSHIGKNESHNAGHMTLAVVHIYLLSTH